MKLNRAVIKSQIQCEQNLAQVSYSIIIVSHCITQESCQLNDQKFDDKYTWEGCKKV